MESEIISSIFVLCYTKIHVVLSVDHLGMYDFVISCIGHLENTGSLNYADFLDIDTFYFTVTQSHIHEYHHQAHQKRL